MKRENFAHPGIRIETWFDGIRNYVCWKPHISVFCADRSEVLRFISWPPKTPTGDALRDWLKSKEHWLMTLATTKVTVRSPMELNRSLTTPRGRKQRKQKPLTMEETKELYEQRIYMLYRQAVDY
jgi:hypothetical protein